MGTENLAVTAQNPTAQRRLQSRPSLRGAIDAMCRSCIYDPHQSGTWRAQVEACTARTCPLYAVRPRATGQQDAAGGANTGRSEGFHGASQVGHARHECDVTASANAPHASRLEGVGHGSA